MKRIALLGIVCAGFGVAAANAQPAAPQATTASYGDWMLRCVAAEGTRAKACEIVQSVNVQGQAAVISQVVIGRPAKDQPAKIIVQLPPGVWLPAPVKLTYDAKQPPVSATFKRCLMNACFADADLSEDLLKKFRAASAQGKIEFEDQPQRNVTLPLSFNGVAPALDALAKE